MTRRRLLAFLAGGTVAAVMAACGEETGQASPDAMPRQPEGGRQEATAGATQVVTLAKPRTQSLTLYSGRTQSLIAPVLEQFTKVTGIGVETRYGETSEMAATILEEGGNSPADAFLAQDAGALGAVARENRLSALPAAVLERVEPRFRSPQGRWVGLTGRARVVVYNTDLVKEEALPKGVVELKEKRWEGLVGWAPSNGSFQAFVTALRLKLGDEETLSWVKAMVANKTKVYKGNAPIVEGVINGEIHAGLVNHYYLMQQLKDRPAAPARNHFLRGGDPGALVNVSGAGVVGTSKKGDAAVELLTYLLGAEAQQYFADQTFEYPLVAGVAAHPALPKLQEIETPAIDLGGLSDLQKTLALLREAGAL